MLLVKETKKLFMDKYGHKIVFVIPSAGWFRGSNIDYVRSKIKNFTFGDTDYVSRRVKTKADLDYCLKICNAVDSMSDYEIRVETPFLSFYTNNSKDIDKISKIAQDNVKYICRPPADIVLSSKTVIMKQSDFGYKVTLGSTKTNYSDFIEWADKTGQAKLTKSTRRELANNTSWGGTYFYVKDDKSLLMTKMFLGGCISRVDKVVVAGTE
jgi:hypothetical protein